MAFIGRMIRARLVRHEPPPEPSWAPEASGLAPRQLAAGAKALALLRLDGRREGLSPQDALCLLRAVGLVRGAGPGTRGLTGSRSPLVAPAIR
jgi:hypothetical protein